MRRLVSMIFAALAASSHSIPSTHTLRLCTPNEPPPSSGRGNMAAKRASKKRKNKTRARRASRRKH